ncbi:MAG: response regulator [Armatimonadetes bacterium]|nr:response regulator [Armatimonadota bacterium]
MMITVVLVEDVRAARLLVRRTLERRPDVNVVDECGTAAEALAACQRWLPDIIFLDLRLPDQDGALLLGPLRQLHPTVRVIVLTSDYQRERALLAAGAQAYMAKPVVTELLLDVVDEVMAIPDQDLAPRQASKGPDAYRQRVLLVDDDQSSRRLLSALVYRLGASVVGEVARLADLEQALRSCRPDLCLLDVEMDEGSSLGWLASHPQVSMPPTIVVSSHAECGVVAAAVRAGASGYVLKPVEPRKLAAAMEKVRSASPQLAPAA